MESRERSSRAWLCLLLAVGLGVILLYGRIDYTTLPYSHWDLMAYRRMAAAAPGLSLDVPRPFVHRPLGPWLAGLAPLPEPLGFQALTIVASLALTGLFYGLLRRQGFAGAVAALVALMLLLNKHLLGFPIWNCFQLNDLLGLVALVVALSCLYERRWGLFGLALAAGVMARETVLVMIPVAAVYLAEERSLAREGKRLLLAVAPAVVCFLLVRWTLQPVAGPGPLEALRGHMAKLYLPGTWYRLLVRAFIPVSLLPVVFFSAARDFYRTRLHLLVLFGLTLASTLFAHDNERLMAPAFVTSYLLLARLIQDRFSPGRLLVAVLLLAGFLASLDAESARFPLPDARLAEGLGLVALGGVTLAGLLVRARRPGVATDEPRP